MLQSYSKQEDVPEGLREHYSKASDGKWYPDVADDHPLNRDNTKLKTEKATADAKVTDLTTDLEKARAGNVGRGQAVVTKAEVDFLEKVKPLGTADELVTKIAEHKTFSDELAARKRSDSLRQLAKDLSLNEEAFVRLPNLPEFESRAGKDGKTEWIAKIKDEKGVITEKPAQEFIELSTDIAPFMAALKTTAQPTGVKLPVTTGSTAPSSPADPFAAAKAFGEEWNKSAAAGTNVVERFGLAPKQASA